jgi:hypothetical protein
MMHRKQFFWVLLVAALAGFSGGAVSNWFFQTPVQAGNSNLITAGELRLVDDSGRTRALLSLLRGKPRLIMTDDHGEFRIELGLGPDGEPTLWLRDREGKARGRLSLSVIGSPGLEFIDPGGRSRCTLSLDEQGDPSLFLRDAQGRDRLALWEEKEKLGLALADPKGRPRAGLALKDGENPSLTLYNDQGQVLWHAPETP